METEELREGFRRISLKFGYMDEPNVPSALKLMAQRGEAFDLDEVTYYVGGKPRSRRSARDFLIGVRNFSTSSTGTLPIR